MVSVDLIAMVTSEASDGHERRLRVKVTSEASYGRVQWHSYGGRFWSVLPHPAHFVIPVISLTSSSLCPHSLRYPCVLTLMEEGSGVFFLTAHFVIPVSSLTSSSLCSHTHDLSSHPSHRYPWLLSRVISPKSSLTTHSHITRVTTHPILSVLTHTHTHCTHQVISSSSLATHSHHSSHTHSLIPAFSLTSLLWVLTPITCLLTLTISHRVSPHALSHPSHLCHHTEWSHITCVLRECLFPLPWCRTTTKSTLTLSSLSHTLPSMSSLWTLPWCRTTTKSTHSLLWESVCSHSHSHGVVLPPSHHSHPHQSLCSHSLHFTSFSLQMHHKCITNASQMHHQPSPTLSHPSCLHHIIITSSPLPITYHHQSLPLTPYNTPNPSISLPTLPIVS